MDVLAMILSIATGVMHIIAFWAYHRQMLKGFCFPQLGTWGLWVFISTTNCISYIIMSGDIIKGILPIASTIACIWVFIKAVSKNVFVKFDLWDKAVFWTGIIALGFWWHYRSATYGNLLLQISIAVSFIPTYRGIIQNPKTEKRVLPWFVWSFAYLLNLIVIFFRWRGQYQDLVYPINCLVLHFAVGVLVIIKNTERRAIC